MRALVVGAGVVGQVYGRHLSRGGAEVGFLVKPKHARGLQGFTLYALNRSRRQRLEPETWSSFTEATDLAQVAQQRWDQVYVTVSSTAFRAGTFFADLVRAVGDATVVMLQPGPEDTAFALRYLPRERLVEGVITLIGYHGPLPGETRLPTPGTVYWFPPLGHSPMSGGSSERLQAVLGALHAGGLPTRRVSDVTATGGFAGALFMPLIAMLEASDWSFAKVRSGGRLALAARAGRQAMAAVGAHTGKSPPLTMRALPISLGVRALLSGAGLVFPFALEPYLKVHFTKVGDQTRDMLRTYHAWGKAAGLPLPALEQVMAAIGEAPANAAPR